MTDVCGKESPRGILDLEHEQAYGSPVCTKTERIWDSNWESHPWKVTDIYVYYDCAHQEAVGTPV